MNHAEEKLQFINHEITLKEDVLKKLNGDMNNVQKALEIAKSNYAQELEKVSSAFLVQMTDFEKKLKKPEQTLDLIYDDLQNKKDELEGYKKELIKWQDSLTDKEKEAYDIESNLEEIKETAMKLWNKLFEGIILDIRSNKEIVDQRSKLLDVRFKRLEREEKLIRDKISSLRFMQNEFLIKQVNKNGK